MDVKAKKKVELAAVDFVTKEYKRIGYNVVSVEKDNVGWDLEASSGKIELHLEVKGLAEEEISVHITPNEYSKMKDIKHNSNYRLCVVANAIKEPELYTFIFNGKEWICEEDSSIALSFDESIAAIAYVK